MTDDPAAPPLIVLGAGDFNAIVIDEFARSGEHYPYRLAGFAQNLDPSRRGESIEGLPVYTLDQLRPLAATHHAICLLGDPGAKRKFVGQAEDMGFRFASVIHPDCARVGKCEIGEGAYITFGTTILRGAKLGKHCTVLTQSVLGEGSSFGDCCSLSPGIRISGNVTVGDEAFIGVGAIVTERVRIGNNAIVGAGSVVIRDVPDGAVVVGNPAREIERKGGPLKPERRPADLPF